MGIILMLDEVDTPSLIVDMDRMEDNIGRMVKFTKECGVSLRPHVKTHKVPEIAKMQLSAGSTGVCLQKVGEVEVFADHGIRDIFLTNEVVVPQKMERLARVAEKSHIGVAVDDIGVTKVMGGVFKEAGTEVDVYVDVDAGMHRCGVSSADAPPLALEVSKQDGLVFKGLMGYEGHVHGARTEADQLRLSNAAMAEVAAAKDGVEKKGMKVEVVSVGSSVSTHINAKNPIVTEVQPGMYVFNDQGLIDRGVATKEQCALTVLATVMSRQGESRAVVDAGSKAFNFDTGKFPTSFDRPGVTMDHFSEEHGWLDLSGEGRQVRIGDRIRFIPQHCCTAVNQHDEMVAIRGERVERVFSVAARGKMK